MKKETLLNTGRFAGVLIIIAGVFFREWLSSDKSYIALALIVIGVIMNVTAAFFMKKVYICPECKKQIEMPKGEIVLTTGTRRNALKAALLTCPYCKKTNLCVGKRVAK